MKFDLNVIESGFGSARIEPLLKSENFLIPVFEGQLVQIQKFEVKIDGTFEPMVPLAMYNSRIMDNKGVTGIAYTADEHDWHFVPVERCEAATFHVEERGKQKRVVAYSRTESSGRKVVWVLRNPKMDELDK
jgi:hypothetical protein